MIDYNFSEKGEYTRHSFFDKIKEAKTFLIENDSQLHFKESRHSIDVGYTINEVEYFGEFITYEMKIGDKHIANLKCFLSSEMNYMEVILNHI